ncbi:hypothetical protein [Saccharothrix syringae]|uniref:hypothetical protein n=1 Tax=Saccharothrix syringae TaxID=103733 RepID=UPI000AB37A1B|nr:hypothetical protein [Saccharothrix syringae]
MYSVLLVTAALATVFLLGALAGNGYTTRAQHQRGEALARRRRELATGDERRRTAVDER